MEHWFWTLLSALILGWYIVVTIIVAFKGSGDIRKMIEKMKKN
ncbi:hypothetical protein [Maribacter sp. 2304DJ31-5]